MTNDLAILSANANRQGASLMHAWFTVIKMLLHALSILYCPFKGHCLGPFVVV